MKKIGIVTIQDYNIGNRLQNYALQEVLKSMGYYPETLQRGKNDSNITRKVKHIAKSILRTNDYKFGKFNLSINWSKYGFEVNNNESINSEYDVFIAGSDQIWNPNFPQTDKYTFLDFTVKNKSISYAASFGVDKIPDKYRKEYSKYLRNIAYISVREKNAIDIVEDIAGCKAKLVLDPTLLLNRCEWDRIKTKVTIKEKFVLRYMLGEITPANDEAIKELFGNIRIIEVKDLLKGKGGIIGPSEFLSLVEQAELICTDSYHACIFSTIYQKPFIVFERQDQEQKMSSRIDTLCDLLDLECHRYSSNSFDIKNVLTPNYTSTFTLLRQLQVKSLLFIKNAIEGNVMSNE